MLSISLVGGLGDFIDQNDPCTLNPSDPICQATAADTAADPCKVNPSASYCQAAINAEAPSLPTPGQDSNTSSWTSFLDTSIPAVAAVVNATQNKPKTPTLNPTQPATSSAAASLANLKPSTPMLIGLGVLTVIGIMLMRRRQAAAAA